MMNHFHVCGRTRSGKLVTLGSWRTKPEALADMRSYREDLKNGIDFRGCVRFRVAACKAKIRVLR